MNRPFPASRTARERTVDVSGNPLLGSTPARPALWASTRKTAIPVTPRIKALVRMGKKGEKILLINAKQVVREAKDRRRTDPGDNRCLLARSNPGNTVGDTRPLTSEETCARLSTSRL
jgi:hypothetical protein